MAKIIIIGGGGHARSCLDVISTLKKFKFAGYIDNKLKNKKIIGKDNELHDIIKKIKYAIIGIGHLKDSKKRIYLYKKLKKIGFKFPVICSPKSYISKSSQIGEGTIVMHGAIINSSVKVGKNSIINTGAILEHDVVIGDNCHVSTSVTINGGAIIGKNTFIGSKSVVVNNIKIAHNKFIKANSFIKDDIL